MGLLQQLLNTPFEELTYPLLVIPWMVLQELDGLMKGNRKGLAQIGVKYIDGLLSSKHPRVCGQKPSEVALGQDKFQGTNEDDTILQCAVQCCDKYSSAVVVSSTA